MRHKVSTTFILHVEGVGYQCTMTLSGVPSPGNLWVGLGFSATFLIILLTLRIGDL